MHIIFYSHVFLPIIGGIQTSTVQYAQGLIELGHRVTVVSETPAEPAYDKQFNFPVVRLDPQVADWDSLLADADAILSNGFSLKHLRAWRKSKIPFGWIHQMLMGDPRLRFTSFGIKLWFRYYFRKWATRYGHFNVCVSGFMKDHVKAKNGVVVYNPVGPQFEKSDAPADGPIRYFGRMWNAKGIYNIIEAVKICRDKGFEIPVEFIGDGQDKDEAIQIASKLGVMDLCTFLPFVQGEALVKGIQSSKYILVPTIIQEPFGLAAAEPMACGKCVVGSKGGGLGEILEGVCPTFEGGKADELAAIMLDLHHHPEKIAHYEKLGYESAHRFRRDVICKQYEEILLKAIEANAHRRKKPAQTEEPVPQTQQADYK
jgi:glycosyltransferase involved in cell wall biosynthesis